MELKLWSFEWFTHLCEYYNVSPEEALLLGTRADGRKPNLPGSISCKSVSDKTYEDIWDEKERKDTQSVFDFYKDQGSWSVFRQCVRHKDMEKYHLDIMTGLTQTGALFQNMHICEYGAGVAPFLTTLMKCIDTNAKMTVTITDVQSEHFEFAKYRLNDIKEKRCLDGIDLIFEEILPEKLPEFNKKLNVVLCFEVLEHVPSPVAVINNMIDRMEKGAVYIENFIKHEVNEKDVDGPDRLSARKEREAYYEVVNNNFNLLFPTKEQSEVNPNITRIWTKK